MPQQPSIFEHVLSHINPDLPGLMENGDDLPDEDIIAEGRQIRFAPGAMEGCFARHFDSDEEDEEEEKETRERVALIHKAIVTLSDKPSAAARERVRQIFREGEARKIVLPLIQQLAETPPKKQNNLYQEMKQFFLKSSHREDVKYSLVLLSCFHKDEDIPLFRTIGRHEEFTYYAALALAQTAADPLSEWMDLMRHVTGWGKIELVGLLLQNLEQPVCHFLLRAGCTNSVMNGYTALPIASLCNLHGELTADNPDKELLQGAQDIIASLLEDAMSGGPDGDMFDYPEGGQATENFLRHFDEHTLGLETYLTVDAIWRFVLSEQEEEKFLECGFAQARRERLRQLCQTILKRPCWKDMAQAALDSDSEFDHHLGITVSRRLGLPVRDFIIAQLKEHPHSEQMWWELVRATDEEEMDEVLRLVPTLIDVDSLPALPGTELGLGSQFLLHRCVNLILQELQRFPGKGWFLIDKALHSEVVSNRLLALRALSAWSDDDLSLDRTGKEQDSQRADFLDKLKESLEITLLDPDEKVREACADLLARLSGN